MGKDKGLKGVVKDVVAMKSKKMTAADRDFIERVANNDETPALAYRNAFGARDAEAAERLMRRKDILAAIEEARV